MNNDSEPSLSEAECDEDEESVDWMQDVLQDPRGLVSTCYPCAPTPTLRAPTLQEFKSLRPVCKICDAKGVYESVYKTMPMDQLILGSSPAAPSLSMMQPTTPMPTAAPQQICLSSCIPEAPEDEVVEAAS